MQDETVSPDDVMNALEELYRDVDRAAGELAALHKGRIRCRQGCSQCCVDHITVFEVEARNISAHYPGLLEGGAPHAAGSCAFLDGSGACRIYPHRPYVCRTQGLPLRWIEETEAEKACEMRDICPVNDTGTPVESLPEDLCWTIGPFELRLAALQAIVGGTVPVRIPLRSLFMQAIGMPVQGDESVDGHDEAGEDITLEALAPGDEGAVIALLADSGLPTRDLPAEKLHNFLVARTGDGRIIGAVGCEVYGLSGLIRSLVVHASYRGLGLGGLLVDAMETNAREQGITDLYLLTTTAADFFPRLGYSAADRGAVPPSISATTEFTGICPVSSTCLHKRLHMP